MEEPADTDGVEPERDHQHTEQPATKQPFAWTVRLDAAEDVSRDDGTDTARIQQEHAMGRGSIQQQMRGVSEKYTSEYVSK